MKEADHSNVKMKWFAGSSSTNAEGKFEYQEGQFEAKYSQKTQKIGKKYNGPQIILNIDVIKVIDM